MCFKIYQKKTAHNATSFGFQIYLFFTTAGLHVWYHSIGQNLKFNETQIGMGDKNQGLFENTGDKYNVLNYHSGTNWKNQDGTDLVTVKSYIIKCRKVNLSGI